MGGKAKSPDSSSENEDIAFWPIQKTQSRRNSRIVRRFFFFFREQITNIFQKTDKFPTGVGVGGEKGMALYLSVLGTVGSIMGRVQISEPRLAVQLQFSNQLCRLGQILSLAPTFLICKRELHIPGVLLGFINGAPIPTPPLIFSHLTLPFLRVKEKETLREPGVKKGQPSGFQGLQTYLASPCLVL